MSAVHEATAPLAAELEAAALRALAVVYADLNLDLFRGALRTPSFGLDDAAQRLGRWVPAHRTIEISRRALREHGWGVLVEVLKHEMAHQYVDEVLGMHDEGPHGAVFQRVCAERGIDAAAVGVPEVPGAPDDPRERERARVLERVAKLLALAQSPDLHEAQSAANAAQRLMLKHNIDEIASARGRSYAFRHLGEPTTRIEEPARLLGQVLHEHYFVETIWVPVWRVREGKRGQVLEVVGSRENVEMAAYVHSFLRHTAEGLWLAHKRARGIRGERDRRAYLAGVIAGFREKLAEQRRGDDARGLVWVGDPELGKYYRRRHPRVRTVWRASTEHQDAHAHGRAAGRAIVLHKGVEGRAPAGPRLLGRG